MNAERIQGTAQADSPDTDGNGKNPVRHPPRDVGMADRPAMARPVSLALQDRKKAELWRTLALVICIAAMTLSYLMIRSAREEEHILVLDSAGNILAGPTEALSDSQGFFNLTALYCTHTAFQRSSAGFDLYEMLHLYFSPRAVQKLEEHWQGQKEDAKARNLQQKPVVDLVAEPVKAGSLRIVETRGRLIRAGAYAGRSFYDEVPFILVLSFRRNPDLGKAGAYPWICEDVDIETREPPRER